MASRQWLCNAWRLGGHCRCFVGFGLRETGSLKLKSSETDFESVWRLSHQSTPLRCQVDVGWGIMLPNIGAHISCVCWLMVALFETCIKSPAAHWVSSSSSQPHDIMSWFRKSGKLPVHRQASPSVSASVCYSGLRTRFCSPYRLPPSARNNVAEDMRQSCSCRKFSVRPGLQTHADSVPGGVVMRISPSCKPEVPAWCPTVLKAVTWCPGISIVVLPHVCLFLRKLSSRRKLDGFKLAKSERVVNEDPTARTSQVILQ